ncbi:MAG: serine hydrolase domain-containing protein [Planctomycetaceae bacterium]
MVLSLPCLADGVPVCEPGVVGMDSRRLAVIDDVVNEGLQRGNMPGCVVLVGHRGHVVYHRAFGFRQLVPEKLPMQADTVFDLASLTKPIATATCIMALVESGQLDLNSAVSTWLPDFAANGKEEVTIRQLLVHTSGLIPDNSMKDYADGPEAAFERIHQLKLTQPPGTRVAYSDVGFIVLAEIVQKVTGKTVHEYSQEKLFQPLGMKETGYLVSDDLKQRAATTEVRDGRPMQGEVHDPRAWALGGVAGHAGLFSTAPDLARFAQMLIDRGQGNGRQILKPETVSLMTQPVEVSAGLRTPGWDMKSTYSSNRGDLFSATAFGHGGFTGTSFWVDPSQSLFVICLSNRVHPDGKGSVNSLAGRIGTIAAAAIVNSAEAVKSSRQTPNSDRN